MTGGDPDGPALVLELQRLFADAGAPPPPDEDLAGFLRRIRPRLIEFGITRVADITGLDTVGIPVFAAIRPNARSLSVAQGKGLRPELAEVGAIMEALEQASAERSERLVVLRATRAVLEARGHRCVDLGTDGGERAWCRGVRARSGEVVFLPYEHVGLDFREPSPWRREPRMSTIGLGAGRTLAEAVTHAVLELVERDATALVDALGLGAASATIVEHAPTGAGDLDVALRRVEAAGLRHRLVAVRSDGRLPVLGAFVGDAADRRNARVFAGFACRLRARDAALAALLEAVQSRAAQIAGARDDLTARDYGAGGSWPDGLARAGLDELDAVFARNARSGPSDDAPASPAPPRSAPRPERPAAVFAPAEGAPAEGAEGAPTPLRRALDALSDLGADDLHVAPLGGFDRVRVVRAVAPGLDAAARDGPVRLGARAIRRFLDAAAGASSDLIEPIRSTR